MSIIRFLFVNFGSGTHAGIPGEGVDPVAFDRYGGAVAHAFYPSQGRIHFDEDEKFSYSGRTGGWWLATYTEAQSLFQAGTHEIERELGLGHSDVEDSIMWPYAKVGNPSLHSDDDNGINAL